MSEHLMKTVFRPYRAGQTKHGIIHRRSVRLSGSEGRPRSAQMGRFGLPIIVVCVLTQGFEAGRDVQLAVAAADDCLRPCSLPGKTGCQKC